MSLNNHTVCFSAAETGALETDQNKLMFAVDFKVEQNEAKTFTAQMIKIPN